MTGLRTLVRWFTPGLGVKRWLLVLFTGVITFAVGFTLALLRSDPRLAPYVIPELSWLVIIIDLLVAIALIWYGIVKLSERILAPYRRLQQGAVLDVVYAHSKRSKGIRIVALGGGTGLPAVLRGLKVYSDNITAVVTVADDGGSSGRLRRELGVLPPGDLRNNIAALADDESLMTQLFQYRFKSGDLSDHAFGNLFIAALAGVTGSLETALIETARVLNIQGRVLPSTLEDVTLVAQVLLPNNRRVQVHGESKISEAGGRIEHIAIDPADATACVPSIQAILEADLVVIGPGSLYTSIIPNLLVTGISDALRRTTAHKVYVCNVAQQPGETVGYTVADHVLALEAVIGRGVIQTILANNAYYELDGLNANTLYVRPAPPEHDLLQRYDVRYTDLVDPDRPWRHDAAKLSAAILSLAEGERSLVAALVHG